MYDFTQAWWGYLHTLDGNPFHAEWQSARTPRMLHPDPVINRARKTLAAHGIPYGIVDSDRLRAETLARAELARD